LRPVQIVARRREALKNAEAQLRLLGPEQVLARGYSITMDAESGRVLRESKSIKSGQRLKTRLKIGEVLSRVEES
jgi:exodeoxyribonuclease VII large subunit